MNKINDSKEEDNSLSLAKTEIEIKLKRYRLERIFDKVRQIGFSNQKTFIILISLLQGLFSI